MFSEAFLCICNKYWFLFFLFKNYTRRLLYLFSAPWINYQRCVQHWWFENCNSFIFKQPFLSKYMAGWISGKWYRRVYYWRFPKHFPLLLKAEKGTLCCTVVHQACFFHFPLICYCSPRSSRAPLAVLWRALAAALLVAGIFLLLAHSGSSFINICGVNTGLHIHVGMHVGFFPKCWCWRAVLYIFICSEVFLYSHQNTTLLTGVRVALHLRSDLDVITLNITLLQSCHAVES